MGLEYDGSQFAGWQAQLHAPGIQTAVETALSSVANHPVNVVAAGRTDAGVHACIQVIHFDTAAVRSERNWVMGANTYMPTSLSALWARPVPDSFNARFRANARSYRYVILNRVPRPAVLCERVCWIREPLDAAQMNVAAQHLVGEHDFSSYRAAECQSPTPIRRLYRISVQRQHEYVVIDVTANAFLHHMVRNIAGTLIAVGRGLQSSDWPLHALQAKSRAAAGITAPAGGLYLFGIYYPEALDLPCREHCSIWPPGPEIAPLQLDRDR